MCSVWTIYLLINSGRYECMVNISTVRATPRTHKTAQSIKELNQAVINAMLAERSSAAAQDNLRRASSAARGATREAIRARMDEILQETRVRTAGADAAAARQNAYQATSGLQGAAESLKSQQDNPLFRATKRKMFPAGGDDVGVV